MVVTAFSIKICPPPPCRVQAHGPIIQGWHRVGHIHGEMFVLRLRWAYTEIIHSVQLSLFWFFLLPYQTNSSKFAESMYLSFKLTLAETSDNSMFSYILLALQNPS